MRQGRRRAAPRILIGTSGWSYKHWRGVFYPEALPASRWLSHYIRYFSSVEINGSFYGLPAEHSLTQWHDTVPEDFVFAIKASRYITHMKKLNQPQKALQQFMARAERLGDKLGPILFQLPPRWQLNLERLAAFLKALPRTHRYAMEFRDPSWWVPQVYELLARHGVAHCIFDLNGRLSPVEVTADFAYVRLHGPDGPYQGQYGDAALAQWAETCRGWRREGRAVYCYFDNDQSGYAARDAQRLTAAVARAQ
jgi:uncharacterized protein YecE (DUF72 family)